ncbi:fimbrial protein [Serratia fonticola]|uniref:fimbrial protein n=1 Tax=Serratia fonticola TaxID=47917 RepID=UPI0013774270|nr:fimbrial protein [Serratia fonticola]NCG53241.1 hypothetical protein [Serratia fonticola]
MIATLLVQSRAATLYLSGKGILDMKSLIKTGKVNRYQCKGCLYRFILLILMALNIQSIQADETLVIGSGKGVVWEGLPFSGTFSRPVGIDYLPNGNTLIAFGESERNTSFLNNQLSTVNGIVGYRLVQGVVLVPRVTVSGFFTRYNGETAYFSGTMGMGGNKMFMDNGKNMNAATSYSPWAASPEGVQSKIINYYFSPTGPRVINYSGTWTVVADGTQTSFSGSDFTRVVNIFIGSTPVGSGGPLSTRVAPGGIRLRVTSLTCSVSTTTMINFGSVRRNTQAGAELARLSFPLTTSCSQNMDNPINANINVQFRAITGNYNSTPAWLSLTQGGGYITGEIDNGVTGSGACTGNSGIPFDNTQLMLGSVTPSEASKMISNNIIWRLCSGGANLPSGAVDASAEMLVTFN